jgi:hypothetical protein
VVAVWAVGFKLRTDVMGAFLGGAAVHTTFAAIGVIGIVDGSGVWW